jgi:hypothetical protein
MLAQVWVTVATGQERKREKKYKRQKCGATVPQFSPAIEAGLKCLASAFHFSHPFRLSLERPQLEAVTSQIPRFFKCA